MATVFKLDSRDYSFTDGDEITSPFNETGAHAYSIGKIPAGAPYNANAHGPVFQSDAPKRFEFEIVGGSGNPYSGLILPATVNDDLTDLGGSAFSIVVAFRMRDFHVSASNNGMLMFCQGVAGDLGSWSLTTAEVSASTFRIRLATTNAAGSVSLVHSLDQTLDPDTWWVVSLNYNGSTSFWHLDMELAGSAGTGMTNPGTRTSVAGAIGVSNAVATSMDGDLGYLGIFKPHLTTLELRTVECDLMDYFKGQPCIAETGYRFDCSTVDSQIN